MRMADSERTYCRFCLSFCGLKIDFDGAGVPVSAVGDPTHPLSLGYSCQKGRRILDFYNNGRLLQPMRFGQSALTWPVAFEELAGTIRRAVASVGPDAVALYAGTNALLDATGMWTALGFMYRLQSNSIYTVASVDAINKQVALENLTGHAAGHLIPQADFERTDCLLLIGSNPAVSHGHLAGIPYPQKRLRDLRQRGGQLIVVDPRETRTAKLASLHLAPRPDTDYAWLGYVLNRLLADPAGSRLDHPYIRDHVTGLDELASAVAGFDEALTCRITGLKPDQLEALVQNIQRAQNLSALTGTGASFGDSGVVTEWFLWSLLALKGKLDRPGGVWFNPGLVLPSIAPAGAGMAPSMWTESMAARPDLPAKSRERPCAALADEILAGHVKVLICLGGNPINAFPNPDKTLRALAQLEALVVLDTHRNDWAGRAHYALPVCAPLERADSTIYTQASLPLPAVTYTPALLAPPGEVKPAWWVFAKLGEGLGLDTVKLGRPAEELTDLDVLKTIKGGRAYFESPAFLADRVLVKPDKPFGWVMERLLPGGKWSLHTTVLAEELRRVRTAEAACTVVDGLRLVSLREEHHLNTQFHLDPTGTGLPSAFLHPADAARRGLQPGQPVTLRSAYGSMQARIQLDDAMGHGVIGVPHGYADQGNISHLTSELHGINPLSGMVRQTGIQVTAVGTGE